MLAWKAHQRDRREVHPTEEPPTEGLFVNSVETTSSRHTAEESSVVLRRNSSSDFSCPTFDTDFD